MKPFSKDWTAEERLRLADACATGILTVCSLAYKPESLGEILGWMKAVGLMLRGIVRSSVEDCEYQREAADLLMAQFGVEGTGADHLKVEAFAQAREEKKKMFQVGLKDDLVRMIVNDQAYSLTADNARILSSGLLKSAGELDMKQGKRRKKIRSKEIK